MPNTLSAKKALRQDDKKRVYNLRTKRALKIAIKAAKSATGDKGEAVVRDAIKLIDKAAQKNVIKKGNAARKKSRLWAQFKSTTVDKPIKATKKKKKKTTKK